MLATHTMESLASNNTNACRTLGEIRFIALYLLCLPRHPRCEARFNTVQNRRIVINCHVCLGRRWTINIQLIISARRIINRPAVKTSVLQNMPLLVVVYNKG